MEWVLVKHRDTFTIKIFS